VTIIILSIIALLSAKSPTKIVGKVGWSEMNMLNNKEATTAPCRTLALIVLGREVNELYHTEKIGLLGRILV